MFYQDKPEICCASDFGFSFEPTVLCSASDKLWSTNYLNMQQPDVSMTWMWNLDKLFLPFRNNILILLQSWLFATVIIMLYQHTRRSLLLWLNAPRNQMHSTARAFQSNNRSMFCSHHHVRSNFKKLVSGIQSRQSTERQQILFVLCCLFTGTQLSEHYYWLLRDKISKGEEGRRGEITFGKPVGC